MPYAARPHAEVSSYAFHGCHTLFGVTAEAAQPLQAGKKGGAKQSVSGLRKCTVVERPHLLVRCEGCTHFVAFLQNSSKSKPTTVKSTCSKHLILQTPLLPTSKQHDDCCRQAASPRPSPYLLPTFTLGSSWPCSNRYP